MTQQSSRFRSRDELRCENVGSRKGAMRRNNSNNNFRCSSGVSSGTVSSGPLKVALPRKTMQIVDLSK